MKKVKIIAGLLAVTGALSTAYAVDKVITVTASIDPTLDLAQADGTALPSTVALHYTPVSGLQEHTIQTRLYTNEAKDVTMYLTMEPKITGIDNPLHSIPLKVFYNGKAVTTTAWPASDALKATIFNEGRSVAMPLTIAADNTDKQNWSAGSYQGVVNLVVAATAG